MKILLVAPKFYNGNIDISYWNFYFPLKDLGHEVKYFDTSPQSQEKKFRKVFDQFQPDLIFCMPTGDSFISPYEPLEEIEQITRNNSCKTFAWFSDDTWRFEEWSSNLCFKFHCCSTSESSYVDKFKDVGYDNIFCSTWHANPDFYSMYNGETKCYDVTFVGALYGDRRETLEFLHDNGVDIRVFSGLSFEEMIKVFASSRISLSFMRNPNDGQLQMKSRPFEIAASNTCLITEQYEYFEQYFSKNREFLTFKNKEQLLLLINNILDKPQYIIKMGDRAYERFEGEHTSQKRLSYLLEEICSI